MDGARLKRLRRAAGLTQMGLSRAAGVSHMRLVYCEGGHLELTSREAQKVRDVVLRAARRNAQSIRAVLGVAVAV